MKIISKVAVTGALIIAFSASVYAGQGKYTVGVSADVTTGGNGPNTAGVNLSQSPDQFVFFYGSYPSITLKARGEHSVFDSTYAFGINENLSNPRYRSTSHSASAAFSTSLGPRWKLNLSDTFSLTSDISTFYLLSGVSSTPDQFHYIFNPVVAKSSRSNTASIGVERELSQKSTLTLSGSHSMLSYGDEAEFGGVLSDQQRFSAGLLYAYTGQRNGWSLGYSAIQLDFKSFQDSRSHSVNLGYSHQFSPVLSLHVSGGPSYVETREAVKHQVGTNASLFLQRTVRRGTFSLFYNQSGGDTSGLGSISSNRQAGLGMTHLIGRKTTLSLDISSYDTRALTADVPSTRGISAGGSLGFAIARRWSMNWGAQYQRALGNSLFGFEQKRVFISFRYLNPELWRF